MASASASGDRNTIRIGGDASGPVVAGNDNHVEVHGTEPTGPAAPGAASGPAAPSGPHQTNTAREHGTVYSVMDGQMHIHHETSPDTDDRDA